MSLRRLLAFLMASVLLASSAVYRAHAEGSDDAPRYEFIRIEGKLYRADRRTGKVELVALPDEPSAKAEPEKPKAARPAQPVNRPPLIESVCGERVQPSASPVDGLVPNVILDADRQRAERDVNNYRGHISLIQLLSVQSDPVKGPMLKGTISVTNNGARRLEALELSLVGEATKEGEQPLLHRFVLGYRPGQKEPPQPAPDSKRSAVAVYLPVGIPVPVGGVSKFDVRVTYLKFADE